MAKRLTTLLKPRPMWAVPPEEELQAAVPGQFLRRVEEMHEGLEHVEISATYMNDAGTKVPAPTFQHFSISEGGRGRTPAVNAEVLARVLYVRCQQYASDKRRKVTFSVVLSGSDSRGRAFSEPVRFQYDGTPSTEEMMEPDQSADEFDPQASDNNSDGIDRPAGDVTEVMPLVPSAALAALGTPEVQSLAIVRVVQAAFAGANAEHRALAQQVRSDRTESIRESRALITTVVDKMKEHSDAVFDKVKDHLELIGRFAMDQVTAANERASEVEKRANERIQNAEQRVQELTRLDGAQAEALMGIARHGWQAFEDGMLMRRDAIGVQQEYDRAFLGLQLQQANSGQRKSAAGGVMKTILPFAATGLSAMLRAKGDQKSADMIDFFSQLIATGGMGGMNQPPGPPPPAAAGAPEPGYASYQAPQGNGARVEQATVVPPIVAAVRQLFDSLQSQQRDHLRQILPGVVWQLLEGAADTDIEAACYACLTQVQFFLASDKALQIKVMMALDSGQQQQLMAIIAAVSQGQAPQAEPAGTGAAPEPGSNGTASPGSNGHSAGPTVPGSPTAGRKMPPRPGATPPSA